MLRLPELAAEPDLSLPVSPMPTLLLPVFPKADIVAARCSQSRCCGRPGWPSGVVALLYRSRVVAAQIAETGVEHADVSGTYVVGADVFAKPE